MEDHQWTERCLRVLRLIHHQIHSLKDLHRLTCLVCVSSAMQPFGVSNLSQGFYIQQPGAQPPCYCPSSAPGPTPMYCAPQPSKCCTPRAATPQPPPARPSNEFHSTGQRSAPLSANRVQGQLPKFDNGMNYIFPKKNCTLHVFENNIIKKYSPHTGEGEIKPVGADLEFQIQTVSCDLTFEELIVELDCVKRANAHEDWQRRGGFPATHIGFREVLPTGHGTFIIGSGITLRDYTPEQEAQAHRDRQMLPEHRSKGKLETLWPSSVGSAGGDRPRYIVRVPI